MQYIRDMDFLLRHKDEVRTVSEVISRGVGDPRVLSGYDAELFI